MTFSLLPPHALLQADLSERRFPALDGSAVYVRLGVSDEVDDRVQDAFDGSDLRDAFHDLSHGLPFDFGDDIELTEELVGFGDSRDLREFAQDCVLLVRHDLD